ncbi:MAG: hypothetical protein NC900_04890 [Candidatus Omnitrophica bacterium]|nr:hypothetical protein [Candidatus Omnitrophota bacterium]MCM8800041.1 hypothetical protein [Candidatus Omnitrophota bacterium]
MMKRIFLTLLLFFIFSLTLAQNWQELKGEHFIVYYTKDERFARQVLDKAEIYYRDIASDLGYPRYSEFWLWDKRVKIYIYPDKDSFLKETGQPSWSEGMADYGLKQIMGYNLSNVFLESILPHEMAHLIFRDFVGFKGEIPLWLDEGVAQWAEKTKRNYIKNLIKKAYEEDRLLSLDDLMKLDIRNIKTGNEVYVRSTTSKDGQPRVLFLSGDNLVNLYYLEAVSLVGFLIERFGSDSFSYFCRQLRDGKRLNEALRLSYPNYIRNIDDLEKYFRKYLSE